MPDLTQVEPTVPAGSGDPDFDAAMLEAGADPVVDPVADPAPVDPAPVDTPAADPDFTFTTLENGQREMKLATGQVYRGKDDEELYGQLAKAQIAASRRITELSKPADPVAPAVTPAAAPEAIDPTALAIADLMAPAFKMKDGAALVAAFAEQQRIANAQQEYMAAQAANMEAAKFFLAVPEFSKSDADAHKIENFIKERGWSFNAENAESAYHTLKAKGEMAVTAANPVRPATPKNSMPIPPAGTAPANTGKGATTEADLWNMTSAQLEELMTQGAPQ